MGRNMITAAALFALLAIAPEAGAQTIDNSLRGVTKLDVLVEQLDGDSAACGITESGLERAVDRGAKGAGFTLDGYDYTLYVRVNTLPRNGDCFSSVDMEAYYYGEIVMPNFPRGNHAEIVLWESSTILISAKGQHGADVSEIVTDFTQMLAKDWLKDNSDS